MRNGELDPDIYSFVEMFDGDDHSAAENFHESTKLNAISGQAVSARLQQIRHDPSLMIAMKRAWKTYPGARVVPLPPPDLGQSTLASAILGRRSQIGAYTGEPIRLEQLSAILRFSFGPTQGGGPERPELMHLRASASAGGLHPIEIYPLVFDVDGLAPGVYHYRVWDHALHVVSAAPCKEAILRTAMSVDVVASSSVVLAITGIFRRNLTKYLHRGYRFLSYDTGALLQSLYLTTTALGLGTCAIGGFMDNEAGDVLGVDNVDENVLMLFTIGGRAQASEAGLVP